MPLEHDGLIKLAEECGELIQAAMKKVACPDDIHWDGSNLKERLEDEIADVRAACSFVANYFELSYDRMADRYDMKRELYDYWHAGGTEIAKPKETGLKEKICISKKN